MTYNDETAAVKMAVKRAKRAGDIETGFLTLKKWYDNHPKRDIKNISKCYKKALKKGII